MAWQTPLRYERLTWPEVRRAVEEDRVCLIPTATLEDHGPHLPIDADLRIAWEICLRAAEAATDDIVLLPAIPHGYTPHHMDFPGPITIAWDTFTRYCTDVGTSLARHGFKRILYLNGHGSNQNLVETAARLVGLEHPDVLAAAAFHTSGPESARLIEEMRDSDRGGMAHACFRSCARRVRVPRPARRSATRRRKPSNGTSRASSSTRTSSSATARPRSSTYPGSWRSSTLPRRRPRSIPCACSRHRWRRS